MIIHISHLQVVATIAVQQKTFTSSCTQCCGSVTFWYGSGSANPCLFLIYPSLSCKFIAHLARSQVTELRKGSLLCLKMRLGKNFRTKKRCLGQFLIWIRIQDSDTDSNPDSNPNPKLTSGRIRIRNRIRNFCFGSATLLFSAVIFGHQNPGSGTAMTKKCWIRIRNKTNADPQHCFILTLCTGFGYT